MTSVLHRDCRSALFSNVIRASSLSALFLFVLLRVGHFSSSWAFSLPAFLLRELAVFLRTALIESSTGSVLGKFEVVFSATQLPMMVPRS